MKNTKGNYQGICKSEKFTNTTDIMESIKSMFADVLNEVLQCEVDEQLGYDKHVQTESGEENKKYRMRIKYYPSMSMECLRVIFKNK